VTTPTRWRAIPLPLLIAVLLVASAALFGVGVAQEHGGGTDTHASVASTDTGGHAETGQEGGKPAEHTDSHGQNTGGTEAAGSERAFGVPLESPAAVLVTVLVSLLLAGLVWRYPRPPVVVVVAVFAAGAAVFDIAEVARQFSAGRAGIGVLAILVAGLHLAVVAAAGVLLRRARRPAPAPALTPSA